MLKASTPTKYYRYQLPNEVHVLTKIPIDGLAPTGTLYGVPTEQQINYFKQRGPIKNGDILCDMDGNNLRVVGIAR